MARWWHPVRRSLLVSGCLLAWLMPVRGVAPVHPVWSFDANVGTVANVALPMRIVQEGFPEIRLTARYRSEPFVLPVYWDLRLSRWDRGRSWELELIHHKLYLDNLSAEVQRFDISHGFNLLFINRGYDWGNFRLKVGAGVVMAHPENTVRGLENNRRSGWFNNGYHLAGPGLNLAIGRPVPLGNSLYLQTEAKTTYAFAQVPVAGGSAMLHNWAFHLVFGLGVKRPLLRW